MEQATAPTRPGLLSALCILSYIGSGIWAIFSLLGIVASGWLMGMLGSFMMGKSSEVVNDISTMVPDSLSNVSAEQVKELTDAADAVGTGMAMGTGMIIGVCAVSLLLAIVSIMGVAKMWKLKKSGFILYAIANGLVLILGVIGGSWLYAVITALFIGLYGMNLKHMK